MDRQEATGPAATASMLRDLAHEIEHGVVRVKGRKIPASDAGVSGVVECDDTAGERLSVVAVRLVEVGSQPRRRGIGQASELERELAHPGD